MLVIRQAQMNQFIELQLREFRRRIEEHLRMLDADGSMDEGAISAMARHVMDKADALGAESEREIALVAEIVYHAGPDFDRQPGHAWVSKLLSESWLALYPKLILIHGKLT